MRQKRNALVILTLCLGCASGSPTQNDVAADSTDLTSTPDGAVTPDQTDTADEIGATDLVNTADETGAVDLTDLTGVADGTDVMAAPDAVDDATATDLSVAVDTQDSGPPAQDASTPDFPIPVDVGDDKGSDAPTPDPCGLPLVTGNCFAAFQVFGFNTETGKCELFIYGGCGGNANNFPTLEACQQVCESP